MARQLGKLGRMVVSGMEGSTGGRQVLKHARKVMDTRGRGMGRVSDLRGMEDNVTVTPGLSGFMNKARSMPRGTRLDINSANSRTPGQLRVTGYNKRGYGPGSRTGFPGTFLTKEAGQQLVRNRNRRLFGYGAGAAGLGVANSTMGGQRGSYRGPGPQIQTPKGVGRNA